MRCFTRLRVLLLCIVLLAAMPAIILIVVDGHQERARVKHETRRIAQYHAEQSVQQIDQLLDGLRHILLVVSAESVVRTFETPALNGRLAEIMELLPHLVNLGVTDERGTVIASGLPIVDTVDLADRVYVQKALQENDFVCGVYQVGRITGMETINFAYPVHDDGRSLKGVLYAALNLNYFHDVLDAVASLPGGDIIILDQNGRILYSRLSTIHTPGDFFPASGMPGAFNATPRTVSGSDKVKREYALQTVSGLEGLTVLVGFPAGESLAAASRAMLRNFVLLAIITVLAAVLALALGNIFIIRRVNAIVHAVDDIAAGNCAVRSGLVHDSGELGRLAGSFDTMADALQKREAALRESEEKFHSLFQFSPVPLVLTDASAHRLMDVNNAFSALFGFTREDVAGKNAGELGLWKSAEQQHEYFERLRTQGSVRAYPAQIRTRSGDVRSVLWSADSIQIHRAPCIVSSALDITEQKVAEAALRHSESLLRSAINQTFAFTGLIEKDGHLVYANKTSLDFIGASLDDVAGKYFWECPWWPDSDAARSLLEPAMQEALSGRPVRHEVHYVDTHGVRRTFDFTLSPLRDEDGTVVYLIPEGRDITELKTIGRQLQQEKDFNRLLLNTSPALIVAIDIDGRTLMMNQAMMDLLEYSAEDVAGTQYLQTFVPEHERAEAEKIFTCLAHGNAATLSCNAVVSKTGVEYSVEWHGRNVSPQEGKSFFVGFGIDITERRRTEKEREHLQAQLNQAQKMESVGRLAGGVAHDFNNMLGVILGHVELALRCITPDQPLYSDLVDIRTAAERSAELTSQLLAFARKQTIVSRVVDLNASIESMLNMLRRLIGEDIDLVWLPGRDLWPVRLDPGQMHQALANLCINARDAITDTGNVTIETGAAVFDELYCAQHAGFIPGEYVLLAVSDNGCGMDCATLANIFDPFFTTKDMDKGTGLGLAMVYGIVKQNDGFINVYSEANQGTTFRIYFPRHRGSHEPAQTEPVVKHAARGTETILLVEDEAAILSLTEEMLGMQGYTVLGAASPAEAIRIAREYLGDIHLLMTDVVMPGMNGRVLADTLLSLHPDLKCLFMSGYTADVMVHHGVLEEGIHFIQKPFSLLELSLQVRETLDD